MNLLNKGLKMGHSTHFLDDVLNFPYRPPHQFLRQPMAVDSRERKEVDSSTSFLISQVYVELPSTLRVLQGR